MLNKVLHECVCNLVNETCSRKHFECSTSSGALSLLVMRCFLELSEQDRMNIFRSSITRADFVPGSCQVKDNLNRSAYTNSALLHFTRTNNMHQCVVSPGITAYFSSVNQSSTWYISKQHDWLSCVPIKRILLL